MDTSVPGKDSRPAHPAHDPAAGPFAICCVLAAHAHTSVPVEDVAPLRKQPGPVCGPALPTNFLKHADEQTVAALTAVFQAIHTFALAPDCPSAVFRDWGVVAAPRFLGRSAMATDLPRFLVEGAWAVSPHMIPHRSLHSISGTISQALKIHGPNYGIGGGPGGETEVLLGGMALLDEMRLPGVWIVMTRLHPELPDDGRTGRPVPGTFCQALALALQPAGARGTALELEVGLRRRSAPPEAMQGAGSAPRLTMSVLVDLLGQLDQHSTWSHPIGPEGLLTLRRNRGLTAGPHLALRSTGHALANQLTQTEQLS